MERENRRWRAASIALLAALLTAAASAREPQPERIKAREFALEDAEGRTRALLRMSPGGNPVLLFLDDEGWIQTQVPWHAWNASKHGLRP